MVLVDGGVANACSLGKVSQNILTDTRIRPLLVKNQFWSYLVP